MTQKKMRKLKEIEDPDFFRFEKVGDRLAGTISAKGKNERLNIGTYVLNTDDGVTRKFNGSHDMDQKMASKQVGQFVDIELVEMLDMGKGKSPMKKFKIQEEEQ